MECALSCVLTIVGPNPSAVTLLAETLKALGFRIQAEPDGETQAILMVDPTLDQLGVLRERFAALPILILADQPVRDADAWAVKPVRIFALASQLAEMVERNGQLIGSWRFFPKIRQLQSADGQTEQLTPKECEVLEYLLEAGGVVAREELQAEVFGYSSQISTHTVETHIHTLRKKLGADLLMTQDDGYRLDQA